MAAHDINDYVILNAKSGVAVFKTYADTPGIISDHFQLTTDGVNGTIKRLTYWPKRLADTTLQQITQP